MTSRVRRALALVLVASALVVGGTASPAHAEAIDLTWPDVTAFNPSLFDYEVGVFYNGTGYLYLTGVDWEHGDSVILPTAIPREGSVHPAFPLVASNEYLLVVSRCPTPTWDYDACSPMKIGPRLSVYNTFRFETTSPQTIGPSDPVYLRSMEPTPRSTYDVDWTVRTEGPDGRELLSGTTKDVAAGSGFLIDDPDDVLPDGVEMRLDFELIGETDTYGTLRRASWIRFQWDSVNEIKMSLSTYLAGSQRYGVDTFYPVRDVTPGDWGAQGDLLGISTYNEVALWREIAIENKAGRIVFTSGRVTQNFWWDGRDRHGDLLPEARYKVVVTTADRAQNVNVLDGWVRLSHDRLAVRHMNQWVTAEEALVSERTGQCGSVAHPGRPDWDGSLGLYADTECARGGRWAHAVFRFPLPRAVVFLDNVTSVYLRGQAAPGSPRSHLMVRTRRADTVPAAWGGWYASWTVVPQILGATTLNPRLLLAAAAFKGNRVDLRDFRVRTSYVAVVD